MMRNSTLLSSPFLGLGLFFCGTIATVVLCSISLFGISIGAHEVRSDQSHAPEIAFYVGVILSSTLWLLGTWTTGIALAVGARPWLRWTGFGLCAAAATVFSVMFFAGFDYQP